MNSAVRPLKHVSFAPTPSTSSGGSTLNYKNLFNMKTLLYVFAAIVALIVLYFLYKYVTKNKVAYKENREHVTTEANSNSGSDAEIMLFYVDWCPHCKTAKPEWEQVKNEYNGKTINGYNVLFTEINCTNESPDIEKMVSQYKIEGYPTIKLLKSGQVIEFDAKPTKDNLTRFLNTVV